MGCRISCYLSSLALFLSASRQSAVADMIYTSGNLDAVGVYDSNTGLALNASLVPGLSSPYGVAVQNGLLYVANTNLGKIGVYNAATGATINASFVSGLNDPQGIAISGNTLYVANTGGRAVGAYNATNWRHHQREFHYSN